MDMVDLVKNIETDDRDIKVYIGSDNNFDSDTTVIKTSYNIDNTYKKSHN